MLEILSRFGRRRHENIPSRGRIDEPLCERKSIPNNFADHVGINAVLSSGGAVVPTIPNGIVESTSPQSLNDSVL